MKVVVGAWAILLGAALCRSTSASTIQPGLIGIGRNRCGTATRQRRAIYDGVHDMGPRPWLAGAHALPSAGIRSPRGGNMRGRPPTLSDIRREIRKVFGPQQRIKAPRIVNLGPKPRLEDIRIVKPAIRPIGLAKGVDYTSCGRYRARIWEGGKYGGYRSLGCFATPEEAAAVYQAEKARLCPRNLPVGVSRNGNRFQASYRLCRHRFYLGAFATAEEASEAYQRAKLEVLTLQMSGSSRPQSE